jgi:hypothetical protein
MQNKTHKINYFFIVIILATFAFLGFMISKEHYTEPEPEVGYSEAKVVNIIGTASSPYRFSADAAASPYSTTTGTFFVGNDVNVLDININVIEASSTMDVIAYIEQSNDADCATTTADGIAGIKWVDASPTSSSLKTTTTTYPFNLDAGHGGKVQITNWNGLCARVAIGSASSTVWVSASKQQLNK